jgi:hypothetical protein
VFAGRRMPLRAAPCPVLAPSLEHR